MSCFLVIYLIFYYPSDNEGCEMDVVHRMIEGSIAWGVLKSVLSNRGQGIKAKKCLYEGVIDIAWIRGMGYKKC